MLSALLMLRRLLAALRVALRDEDFGRILSAGAALIVVGTLAYSLGSRRAQTTPEEARASRDDRTGP
jgi:hypothetical protein